MIYPRSRWTTTAPGGAPLPRQASRLILHHSWRPDVRGDRGLPYECQQLQGIRRYHVMSNGWVDIAYGALVFDSGRGYVGRGARTGAHTVGQNSQLAICFVINGDEREPSAAAWATAREIRDGWIATGALARDHTLHGHRDFAAKSCPGSKTYAVMHERMAVVGDHDEASNDEELTMADVERYLYPRHGDKGQRVKELQRHLMRALGDGALPRFGADGDYGDETAAAVARLLGGDGRALSGQGWAMLVAEAVIVEHDERLRA